MKYDFENPPEREAVSANIKQHKDTNAKKSCSTLCDSFAETLREFAKDIGIGRKLNASNAELYKSWKMHITDPIGNTGVTVDKAIAGRNVLALSQWEWPYISEAKQLLATNQFDKWDSLDMVVSVLKISNALPSKMMERIEQCAGKLHDQVTGADGQLDFSKMDMTKMGHDVLGGCDMRDIESVAQNMKDILPALQILQNAASSAMGGTHS